MAIMKKTATLFLLLVTLVATVAFAADEPLSGHYVLDAKASDNVAKAIDNTVAKMNFITRPIARGRLEKTNPAYSMITLSFPGSNISVQLENRKPIVFPASGAAVKWTREDGETFDVSGRVAGSSLTQTFVAEDGKRVNVFTLSADGKTLTLNVTVTSPRLPKALNYKLVYHRA